LHDKVGSMTADLHQVFFGIAFRRYKQGNQYHVNHLATVPDGAIVYGMAGFLAEVFGVEYLIADGDCF